MMRLVALAVALVLGASGSAGAKPATPADPNLTCKLHHAASYVDSLKKLPADVQTALKATAGAMADRGAFFHATDVVMKPGPFNRFIRGGRSGKHWFVWYEHGGFAYWRAIAILEQPAAYRGITIARAAIPNLCAVTDSLLDRKL